MPDPIQRALGLIGAIVTFPAVLLLAAAVRIDSPGPAIYRSLRIGAGGVPFTLFKLRTMSATPTPTGRAVTIATDSRLTRLGRRLRRLRLDELPQLWNVARGEMRLVGPRPEDPRFVDLGDPLHREVFSARPGVTGLTQLLYADEATLLDAGDPERHYVDAILPDKLRLDATYLRHRSAKLDLWILGQTPRALLGRRINPPTYLGLEAPHA